MLNIAAQNPVFRQALAEMAAPIQTDIQTYAHPREADGAAAWLWLIEDKAELDDMPNAPVFLILQGIEPGRARLEDAAAVFTAPVRPGLLIDRIRMFLKREVIMSLPERLEIGPHTLNTHENRFLSADLGEVRLTEKEKDILVALYNGGKGPIDRQTLLEYVWAYADGVETHTLETHIYRLRQKIEKDPSTPDILLTDGNGYRLNF